MKQVEPSVGTPKGPVVSDVAPRAHSRLPATPSTRLAHKPTSGPLYLLCTAINATAIMAASFSIFNFPLIQARRHSTNAPRIDTQVSNLSCHTIA